MKLDISWIITLIGLTSMWLCGSNIRFGWMVGVLCQVVWFGYGYYTAQYGFVASSVLMGVICLRNWLVWKPVAL